ncbi:esterase-like activity of phytase family protein [Streptomyces sp. NPDC004134]|uniref:esterase-like activity of phytase family protein n=1 Tax=Streptomyces sp. NPDC004134 TaxID=3364691 RepID=UPI00367D6428
MNGWWRAGLPALLLTVSSPAALAAPAEPAAPPADRPAACSPRTSLTGFSDALDKTTFEGTRVAGLSALSARAGSPVLALADNTDADEARLYRLAVRAAPGHVHAAVRDVTVLRRPDGTPYTGTDFDGEGLVTEPSGTVLASSEREPSIRRFRLSDGRQTAELPVPLRFRVAPAGQAPANETFESLTTAPDGRTLYAGLEGPLDADGHDEADRGLLRILRYAGTPGGDYAPQAQHAYRTDPGLGLAELATLDRTHLLALERGYTAGVGNTVRIYRVSLHGAPDVTGLPSLTGAGAGVFLTKRLLVDLADCPPSGATSPQPQPNPLLDNVEGMTLTGNRTLLLVSDDNASARQVTRLYTLRLK